MLLVGAIGPLLQAQTIESYTFTTNRVVPDGNAAGVSDVRTLNSAIGAITSLKVRLKVAGEFNGDLHAYVRHSSGYVVLPCWQQPPFRDSGLQELINDLQNECQGANPSLLSTLQSASCGVGGRASCTGLICLSAHQRGR